MHFGGAFIQLRLLMGQAFAVARPWQRALVGGAALAGGLVLLLLALFVPGILLSVVGVLVVGRLVWGGPRPGRMPRGE